MRHPIGGEPAKRSAPPLAIDWPRQRSDHEDFSLLEIVTDLFIEVMLSTLKGSHLRSCHCSNAMLKSNVARVLEGSIMLITTHRTSCL